MRLGDALRTLGRFAEAQNAYRAVETEDATLRAAALLGSAYCALEAKEYPMALASARECLPLVEAGSRERLEADLVAAGARYGLKEYAEALEGYRKVAAGNQADLAEQALYWAGNSLRALGKPDEAIAQFNQVIQRFANGTFAARAQLRIGDCHADAGRLAEAAAAYRVVLERHAGTEAAKEAQAAVADLVGRAGGSSDPTNWRGWWGSFRRGHRGGRAGAARAERVCGGPLSGSCSWAGEGAGRQADPEAAESLLPAGCRPPATQRAGRRRRGVWPGGGAAPAGKLVNQALLELAWAHLDLKQC